MERLFVARSYPLQFSLYMFIFVHLQSISLLYSTVYKLRLDAALCLRPCILCTYTTIILYFSVNSSQLSKISTINHSIVHFSLFSFILFSLSILLTFAVFLLFFLPPFFLFSSTTTTTLPSLLSRLSLSLCVQSPFSYLILLIVFCFYSQL